MMTVTSSIAPSYRELRPMKPDPSSTFPVYDDLVERLVTTMSHPDGKIAHALATCSGYAYSDADTVAMMMARIGLEKNRTLQISELVDAMFICATSFVVQSDDGRAAILCFRGTEPTSLINWLMVADINPEPVPIRLSGTAGTFDLHGGFYRNVRAIRYLIVTALQRALNGYSILDTTFPVPETPGPLQPLEALYITGHSLGGAMAAIMAIMLTTDSRYEPIAERLRAVYSFGQPMIGTPELAAACDADDFLGAKVVRYVNGRDVVPRLPPKASGKFAHFGREFRNHVDGGRQWDLEAVSSRQLGSLLSLAGAPLAFFARQLTRFRKLPFRVSLYDHFPLHYISALAPPGVRTEFGD